MLEDRFGGRHTTENHRAVALFEEAVVGFAAHRPFLNLLDASLSLDPNFVAAHALSGIAHALIGREHGMAASTALLAGTHCALAAVGGGTAHEQALAAAHQDAATGRLKSAADKLDKAITDQPPSLLAFKLAHALRFMTGDSGSMLKTSSRAVRDWNDSLPGFGFVLGCHAFALEENGHLREAETAGRRALISEPSDVWALHAVAHVLEMDHRTREGRMLLAPLRTGWAACGGFGQHLTWHLALFHLDEGDHHRVLTLYDEAIIPSANGCFRDMSNAVSLLWRLEQEGVDVGNRWEHVHAIAHSRRTDATYAFGSLHYLIALLASSDTRAAHELIEAMRAATRIRPDDQTAVMTEVALPLAEALVVGLQQKSHRNAMTIAAKLPALGGSRAQRDIFLRTLMLSAADNQDFAVLAALSDLRRQQRREDRFTELVSRRGCTQGFASNPFKWAS